LENYEQCLDSCARHFTGAESILEQQLITLFVSLCQFLSKAGYSERAIGLFQAQIELCCFCPLAYASHPLEKRLDLLESFWEKDIPRFGQTGAPGWLNTLFMGKKDFNNFF
jgi:hypothetical protein